MRAPSRWRRRAEDEQGAIIAMTAIAMVSLLGLASLTIDLGEVWSSRRHLVTATDSAAIDAAIHHAVGRGNGDCDLVEENSPGAVVEVCDHVVTSPRSGYTTATATRSVDHLLARLVGIESSDIRASASALYGQPSGVSGLRPFGLCIEAAPLAAWIDDGTPSPSSTYRVRYTKDHPSDCGGNVPGNWGLMDFNGGSNSNSELIDWIRNGYPGEISVGDDIEGDTGAFGNSLPLSELVGRVFPVPIFDSATGNGANAEFNIHGFVLVELVGYKSNGAQSTRYLDVRFRTGIAFGTCCTTTGIDTGIRVVALCHVDHSTRDRDDACRR